MKAVDIYEQKNGKFKVLFTTPNGRTRTIGKFDNKNDAETLANDVLEQLRKYYR